ncbi:GIY-YIG nuclease family protein [Candidatus Saccharibacteria bacterium]|nr:GIY-YIG nuclease family protein [Candidatus Saccharibacteria bacterium]
MFNYPVVFVDIETTGGSYRTSRVLEVAVIRYENGVVVDEFSSLINPERHIPTVITSITGITEADIVGAPIFSDIADRFAEIMNGAVFVAHNVRFDYSFIKNEFALLGMPFHPRLLCTVRLSRSLYASEQGHSLAKLIARYDIPFMNRHRALDDARAIAYFSQMAFDQHGPELFAAAVQHQLKTQSLPPNLDLTQIEQIENVPGVYIFKDETHQPIYVGKSITLKKRVMSHFQDVSPKEVRMSQAVYHIETIPTGSELAALVLESKLVKDLKPLHNRRLRWVSSYAMLVKKIKDGYSTVSIAQGSVDVETDLDTIYGIYPSRMKAKKRMEEITRTFELCPKLMGLEKANGACFSYSLGKCRGACIGEESDELYNRRFELALEHTRLQSWPFDSPIALPVNEKGEQVIIKNWMIQGYIDEIGDPVYDTESPNFDMDEYKIIRRFIRENKQYIRFVTS